ncbi:hypothetical protein Peur_032533 [Populus x canadensis]
MLEQELECINSTLHSTRTKTSSAQQRAQEQTRPLTRGTVNKDCANLDDIVLPFFVSAPKYGPADRPATASAMREALAVLTGLERDRLISEEMIEEIPDEEEEAVEATYYVVRGESLCLDAMEPG